MCSLNYRFFSARIYFVRAERFVKVGLVGFVRINTLQTMLQGFVLLQDVHSDLFGVFLCLVFVSLLRVCCEDLRQD